MAGAVRHEAHGGVGAAARRRAVVDVHVQPRQATAQRVVSRVAAGALDLQCNTVSFDKQCSKQDMMTVRLDDSSPQAMFSGGTM